MNKIKLSILIPTCNYKKGINQILECLINSNYRAKQNIEIIISDDSDRMIIDKKFKNKLKKIFINFKYIHNKVPLGGPKNWNNLISLAKGDYLWTLHHDEFWEKDKNFLESILNTIDLKNPNIIILSLTKQKIIYFKNIKFIFLARHKVFYNIQKIFLSNPKLLIRLNILGPPSVLIYKHQEIKYDQNLKYLVDVDFYIRLLKSFNCKKIIFDQNFFNIISCQNNKNSITDSLKKNIKIIIKKEKSLLKNKYKYKFNFKDNLFIIFFYLILKIFLIATTKIKLDKL